MSVNGGRSVRRVGMQNRGKQFEGVIKESFMNVPNTSVYRLHDDMSGMIGVANVSDFIVYHYPYQYFIECKAVHGNLLSINSNDPKRKYGNISNTQWEGMLELSKIKGVYCGVICWWVDKDVTKFIPIQLLQLEKDRGSKSIRYDYGYGISARSEDWKDYSTIEIKGQKKRVFWDYDMRKFFEDIWGNNANVQYKDIDGHRYYSCDGGVSWQYVYPRDSF